MTIFNHIFPIFFLIIVGVLLKHYGFTHDSFLKTSDRLVYYIFFPALLFWKIGGNPTESLIAGNFFFWILGTVMLIFFISLACIRIIPISDFKAGTFTQSCVRFNSYIGMAVVMSVLGDPGIRRFSLLIGFTIPIINFLVVSVLIWYSSESKTTIHQRYKILIKAIISNPLIIACIFGLIYGYFFHKFPVAIHHMFQLATSITLPLALFSIGGVLNFKMIKNHWGLSTISAVVKLVIYPCIGWALLPLFQLDPLSIKTGMIFFALPTSPAAYILSSQLNSDTQLASASIALSTVLSAISLSIIISI